MLRMVSGVLVVWWEEHVLWIQRVSRMIGVTVTGKSSLGVKVTEDGTVLGVTLGLVSCFLRIMLMGMIILLFLVIYVGFVYTCRDRE